MGKDEAVRIVRERFPFSVVCPNPVTHMNELIADVLEPDGLRYSNGDTIEKTWVTFAEYILSGAFDAND